jgi:hypothetical protein
LQVPAFGAQLVASAHGLPSLLQVPLPGTKPQSAFAAQTVVVPWQYLSPVQSVLVVHCLLVCVLQVP